MTETPAVATGETSTTASTATELPPLRPALHDPDVDWHWYDDAGEGQQQFVRWDLAWGCAMTIGYDDDGKLSAGVSMSDSSGNGHERRRVTREQVAAYGQYLIDLAGASR